MRWSLSRSANSEGGEVFGRLRRSVRSQNLRIFARFCCRSPCGWLICFLGCFCHAWRLAACFARTRPARVRIVTTLSFSLFLPVRKSSMLFYFGFYFQSGSKRKSSYIFFFCLNQKQARKERKARKRKKAAFCCGGSSEIA